MMLYNNTKVMVCSLYDDIDFFDIVAGVLQGASLSPFLICLDYNRSNEIKWLHI